MTSFKNDSGEYLDYSGADILLTKQVATWHDFKLKGDVSVDIKIPDTPKNRKKLNYFGPQSDFTAYSTWNVVKNGNTIMRGQLIVKNVTEKEIVTFFISGNASWMNVLKFNLKEVIWPDSFTVSWKDINTLGGATEGICFPLADWGYIGQKRSSAFFLRPDRQTTIEPTSHEAFPCVYMHSVLDQVGAWAGIKIGGNLKNDPLFQKVLMTPEGPNMACSDQIVNQTSIRLTLTADQSPAVNSLLTFDRIIEKGSMARYESGRYYAPFEGTYRIEGKVVFNTPNNANITVFKGFAAGGTDWSVAANSTGGSVRTIRTYVNMLAGDYVYFYTNLGGGAAPSLDSTTTVSIELEKRLVGSLYANCCDSAAPATPGLGSGFGYCIMRILPSYVVPSMLAVDFIKAICLYFGAYCVYDEYSKTLSINKLDSLRREEADNWSSYFVSKTDVIQTGVAQNNYIVSQGAKEEKAIDYNLSSKVKYGGGVITSTLGIEEEKDIFKLPFAGGWDELNNTRLENGVFLPYIKFYDYEDGDSWAFTGVTNAGQASFTVATGHPFAKGDVLRIYSANDIYSGFGVVTQTTATTVICEQILYISSTSGTLVKQNISGLDGPSRLLVARPSTSYTDLGFNAAPIFLYAIAAESDDPAAFVGGDLYYTLSTFLTGWFDKPQMNLNIDINQDSLSIDTIGTKTYNKTLGERYHRTLQNIYKNPRIEAIMRIPSDVFYNFDFNFVYLKTEGLTGYFFVSKIENYKDDVTPVKVELLMVD